jgi:predicted permease
MVSQFLNDVRLAIRSLRKQPRFTLVASLTLALGIGAVTAIFSVVNGVLLEPLPYPNASRLVNIWSTAPGLGYDQFEVSPDIFKFYKDNATVFEDMALSQQRRATLSRQGGPEVLDAAVTSASYFPTLGASFPVGRSYTAAEDAPTAPQVAVISYRLWKRAFNGDRAVLDQPVRINSEPMQIVGVAPLWMDRQGSPDIWMPTRFPADEFPKGSFGWDVIARLKPGITPAQATTHLEPLVTRAMELITSDNYRAFLTNGRYRPLVHSMKEDIVGDAVRPLWILLGTVGMVLLIACANVANLCLIRAESRQREIGVRLALGGARSTLIRSLMTEAVVLALLGAVAGVVVARLAVPALIRLAPATIPRLEDVRVSAMALFVAIGLAAVSAVIFGLVPAIRYTRVSVLAALRHGGRSTTDSPSRHRGRSVLVAVQTAMAMVLLIGSGLMARSFVRMMHVDAGFDPRGLTTTRVSLPPQAFRQPKDFARVSRQLVDQFAQIPGVTAVAATSNLPIDSGGSGTAFEVEGHPTAPGQLPPIVQYQVVTPGYFGTMHTGIRSGRDLEWRDAASLVVNKVVAERLWPGENPIGRRVRRANGPGGPTPPWLTVVGLVDNIRQRSLRQPAEGEFYFPPEAGIDVIPALSFVIRAPRSAVTAEIVRTSVRAISQDMPIASVRPMTEVIDRSVVQFSFTMLTLGIAAAVALLLGAIGLYSVLSYAVSLQTREIGVRLALGAPQSRVMRTIVARGAVICAIGVAIGGAGAFALTRMLSSLLFETAPLDPVTFGGTAVAILLVALLASYLPARRAAAISPMESMRAS